MNEVGSDKRRFEDMRQALESKSYEIIKSIGKGAFGEVVLARHRKHKVIQVQLRFTTQSKSLASNISRRNLFCRSTSIKKSTS